MKQLRDHKAQGSALFTLVSGIVIVIAVIFFLIKLAGSGSFGDVAETTEAATQTRIQPVGQLKMGDGILSANVKAIRFSTKSVSMSRRRQIRTQRAENRKQRRMGSPYRTRLRYPFPTRSERL